VRWSEGAFGADIDYAMLNKIYTSSQEETRYSPAQCIGCETKPIMGNPNPKHMSTSFAERQNLSMRMMMRRFTRLTNAFSKKVENHLATVAIYFMYYNFARIHQTLRCTPAQEAGVTAKLWSMADVVALLPNPVAKKRGPCKNVRTFQTDPLPDVQRSWKTGKSLPLSDSKRPAGWFPCVPAHPLLILGSR
jgi:hypothetical protein